MEHPKVREYHKGIFRKNNCASNNFLEDRNLLRPDSRAQANVAQHRHFIKVS